MIKIGLVLIGVVVVVGLYSCVVAGKIQTMRCMITLKNINKICFLLC